MTKIVATGTFFFHFCKKEFIYYVQYFLTKNMFKKTPSNADARLATLFHHQISTCTEKVKFRAETLVLRPGTSSGQEKVTFSAWNLKC